MSNLSVNRVAVIGAGISGVVSAAHLLAAGVKVTVFERNKAAGGVWYVLSRWNLFGFEALDQPFH